MNEVLSDDFQPDLPRENGYIYYLIWNPCTGEQKIIDQVYLR